MLIPDIQETRTFILAIGRGDGLAPLTDSRTVAALPFGGNYRIVDFALTNCLHSGLRRIFVMTQFNPLSLHNHLRDAWSIFSTELGEYVMPITPPIRGEATGYNGPAHALFHNLYLLQRTNEKQVLIVSGEQIYRMDYATALLFHAKQDADVTMATIDHRLASGGQLAEQLLLDGDRITDITAAPTAPAVAAEAAQGPLGVYIFSRQLLIELLHQRGDAGTQGATLADLARDALEQGSRVCGYRFGGTTGRVTPDQYWRDLHSIDDYYEANMDLLRLEPLLDLYQTDWPIRSYQPQCPPARTVPGRSATEGICVNSIITAGSIIAGGGVSQSVLSNSVYIDDGATVEASILMPTARVGEGARLHRVICDRGVEIPPRARIGFDLELDARRFTVTPKGIVVVSADARFD
ncbi:MAG: glucose-1-phosphate adenylyltransferase [Gammaproteobacteria bacterium]|nr:glucose-1-phosphate adenylyltransferase [Gammaproteobacteria bacterium]